MQLKLLMLGGGVRLRAAFRVAPLAVAAGLTCAGQSIITQFAGTRFFFPADGLHALDAPSGVITAVASDRKGDLYFADMTNDRVFKIDSRNLLTTVAGTGIRGYSGDGGPATDAAIFEPRGLAFDHAGNLYVCDTANFRIRKVDTSGVITTFAGNGKQGYSGDGGKATAAALGRYTRIAIDTAGNVYISDDANHVVREVSIDGTIRTVAGNGSAASTGDGGPAAKASLQAPSGIAVDASGNLFIIDRIGNRIRRVSASGIITTFAGTGAAGFSGDGGPATKATFRQPHGIAIGNDSSVYIADSSNNRIRRISPTGNINTFAGNNLAGLQGDGGPIASASLDNPLDLAFTPNESLLVADSNALRVRLISGGRISTVAGNGNFRYGGDGGPATDALLPSPSGLAVDSSGNVHLCDTFANRVRTIDTFGIINLTAGTNIPGFAGDNGPAAAASLSDCEGIAVDSSGNLYVADTSNQRIRKIDPAGVISTFAGNGSNAFAGDGQAAIKASLSSPQGVAVDLHGNVYIADTGNNRIRKVNSSGVISTFAGNGKPGYTGDQGPATAAELNGPVRVAVHSSGDIFFSDNQNNVVRKVSSGTITTVAGNGKYGFSGDNGPATAASLANPQGLMPDGKALYIADFDNNRIRRVSPNGTISTFAGTGTLGAGNGGPPQLAGLNGPVDLAMSEDGNIFIATRTGARLRRIQPAPSSIVLSQVGILFRAAVDAASAPSHKLRILNGGAGSISWTASSKTLLGGGWLKISPTQGTSSSKSTSGPITVSVNPAGLKSGNYYGFIRIVSPGVVNSPRFATVVLNVLSASATAGASVDPAGLLFTGSPGGANPGPQILAVSKLRGAAIQFTTSLSPAAPWLSIQPAKGTVAPNAPVNITVAPSLKGLTSQIYKTVLNLAFSDNSKRAVPVVLAVNAGAPASASDFSEASAASCAPTKLVPVSTQLGSGFSVPAGWPVTLEASVVDDCGQPLTDGSVSASFSSGDPMIALASQQDGTWTGTWNPRSGTNVTVTLAAQSSSGKITGSTQIDGSLSANSDPPIISANGVLNGASYQRKTGTAPGTSIAIFGSNFASAATGPPPLPLPTHLGNTEVLVGGQLMPLSYTAPGQINAVVPFEVAAGTTQQVIVANGGALSVPEPVSIAASEPGTFTSNGSGTGAGRVVSVASDGTQVNVSPATPAHAGDTLVISCTGLGDVQTDIDAGEPAPDSPLAQTMNAVSVIIGGVSAKVLFAGLVPGFTGYYQVNAVVPGNAPTGDSVSLAINIGGVSSPTVTIAIH